MIPLVNLDFASLGMWYDPQLINQNEHRLYSESIQRCIFGDLESLQEAINNLRLRDTDANQIVKIINPVSSIWHEHRHFLDLVLTNYGQFYLRTYFSLYVNSRNILKEIMKTERKLLFPLDTYIDPVRCKFLGIRSSELVRNIGEKISFRKKVINNDRYFVNCDAGYIDIGGAAQLESIAYMQQIAAVQDLFGFDLSIKTNNYNIEKESTMLKYRWAFIVANQFNILPRGLFEDSTNIFDITIILPILYGSLMCRNWEYEKMKFEEFNPAYPSQRFIALINKFKNDEWQMFKFTIEEIWEKVNNYSRELWGKTAIEELLTDYDEEEKMIHRLSQEYSVDDVLIEALYDMHELRGKLIKVFLEKPVSVLDPLGYVDDLMFETLPIPIFASCNGQLGIPPDGYERVLGYRDINNKHGVKNEWWWAAGPTNWPAGQKSLCLKRKDAWYDIISYYGPLAKLMINGRRHKMMLGPELFVIENQLESHGIEVIFDPRFKFPEESNDISQVYFLTGKTKLKCDFCKKEIESPEGHVISPWFFRYSLANASIAILGYGGGDIGHGKFLRDWSPWIACNESYEYLLENHDWRD